MSGGQTKTQQGVDSQTRDMGLWNWQNAQNIASQPFQAFDPSTIQQYMDPYINDVIKAGDADLTKQNTQAIQGNAAAAVHQNAFGGNRAAVADSMTNNDYANRMASFDANTRNAGYQNAEQTALQNWQMKTQYPFMQQGLLNSTFGSSVLPTGTQWGTQSSPFDWGGFMSGLIGDAGKAFGGGGSGG